VQIKHLCVGQCLYKDDQFAEEINATISKLKFHLSSRKKL